MSSVIWTSVSNTGAFASARAATPPAPVCSSAIPFPAVGRRTSSPLQETPASAARPHPGRVTGRPLTFSRRDLPHPFTDRRPKLLQVRQVTGPPTAGGPARAPAPSDAPAAGSATAAPSWSVTLPSTSSGRSPSTTPRATSKAATKAVASSTSSTPKGSRTTRSFPGPVAMLSAQGSAGAVLVGLVCNRRALGRSGRAGRVRSRVPAGLTSVAIGSEFASLREAGVRSTCG